MNSSFPVYRHNEAFRRLAVMLLALAGLAERAAGRSWPVRCLVVWLLRPAEAVACALAAELGCVAAPRILSDDSGNWSDNRPKKWPRKWFDNGPGEALHLARIFRALAAAFFAQSYLAARSASRRVARQQGCPPAGWLNAVRLDHLLAALRPRYADSS